MIDFTGWFPTGPLTSLYALILLAVTVPIMRFAGRDNATIAALLFLGWVSARTATWLDFMPIHGLMTVMIMFWLFCVGTRTAALCMGLAAFKLAIYGIQPLGVMNVEQMWALSEVFAYLQLLVLFGGTIDGSALGLYLRDCLHRFGDFGHLARPQKTVQPFRPPDDSVDAGKKGGSGSDR